ncbi:hypothetical protein EJ110_NYTH30338 [Nymphaea thermarum]|nr:hypothetical protein EJ110_NYTH30338 [Nymphaea thermarum]
MLAIGHEKEHVIEENEPFEKSGKYASWKRDNNIVMSWIMNSVQPQIASTIAYYTSAKQMWDFLKQTYSNDKNVSKILQVEEELLDLQQGDQSLAQYFASLKSIYERLKALRPPCPTCHKTHGEQFMVAKFLQGLSPEYAVAKAQMLTGAEIPDLADAYNRLSRLALTLSQPSSDLQASALVASGGRGRGSFRGRGIGCGSRGEIETLPSLGLVAVDIGFFPLEDLPLLFFFSGCRSQQKSMRHTAAATPEDGTWESPIARTRLTAAKGNDAEAAITLESGWTAVEEQREATGTGDAAGGRRGGSGSGGGTTMAAAVVEAATAGGGSGLHKAAFEVAKNMITECSSNPIAAAVEKEAGWLLVASSVASMPKEVVLNAQVFDILALWAMAFQGNIDLQIKPLDDLKSEVCEFTVSVGANTGTCTQRAAYSRETTPVVAQNSMDPSTRCIGRALIHGCVNSKERYSTFLRTPRLGRREPNAPSTSHNSTLGPCTACAPNRRDQWRKRDNSQYWPLISYSFILMLILAQTHFWLAHEVGSLHE